MMFRIPQHPQLTTLPVSLQFAIPFVLAVVARASTRDHVVNALVIGPYVLCGAPEDFFCVCELFFQLPYLLPQFPNKLL